MKKTTLRDVAKEAGVSVATVSYVLNNVSTQTIPEETRQRVFTAASKLHYVQNLTAKSLSLGKTNVLGVLFVSTGDARIPKPVSYGVFLDGLERRCREKGYHLLVSQIDPAKPNFEIIAERKLDGFFLIDAMVQSFHAISRNLQYGSPLVIVDSLIDDSLFRQVNPDFQRLFSDLNASLPTGQPYALIHEHMSNERYHEIVRSASGLDESLVFAATSDEESLKQFIQQHENKPLVVFNEFLALQVLKYLSPENLVVVCTSECPELLPEQVTKFVFSRSKSEVAFGLMSALLHTPFGTSEDQYISLGKKD